MLLDEYGPQLRTSSRYTTFSRWQCIYFTYLLGFLTLASTLTVTIYFPLITLLSTEYGVSIQDVNLTITVYIVLQAVSPLLFSQISDTAGRRPILLAMFFIYTAASLGLALNKRDFATLLSLRAVQSFGGSAIMTLAYAIIADFAPSSERGSYLGPLLAFTNLGPCVGPVIGGGAVLASQDSRWCFWALFIFGSLSLMLVGWTMPETCRNVVGNGAVPARGVWRTWLDTARSALSRGKDTTQSSCSSAQQQGTEILDPQRLGLSATGAGRLSAPSPWIPLRMIFYPDTILIIWLAASPYSTWYVIQTSIPLVFGVGYGFNTLQTGLCFLSGGMGVICGGVIAGRLMDWSYEKTAREHRIPVEKGKKGDITKFPIEEARSRGSIRLLVVAAGTLAGYGWAVERGVHPSIPLIIQFLVGAKCTILLQTYSALLVDIFPLRPGAAGAANNMVRCGLAAGLVAIAEPLQASVGFAWFVTIVALLDGLSCLLAVCCLRSYGQRWRAGRS